ncbi:hypothetical protein GOZ83_10715 [Agrobacterium vitis]|uniref:hypothetical protein n=1 Tax=Rhizobium/Agrobacterium group TaxID=227290 RepID=UPI0012E95532|nr:MULTISPECIES: hypothetical protein [Rhizobium/Agrobacterium group]MCF1449414.1 hypothetical protein [Allorhizobium ampelinum]MCF1492301.1 hypothetical protein [Allorhizobium ampelinum]MVA45546.1 hypothetical protein [Agrobacterium vitis]
MTHADIINLWPSIAEFARDIGASYETAKAMRRRSSIPAGYWVRVVESSQYRHFQEVSFPTLAEAAALDLKEASR